MDIRIVFEDLFEVESEGLVYFTGNAFLKEDSQRLVEMAGRQILEPLSKIQGCATGDVVVVPGFNLKQLYVLLTVIPDNLDSDLNIALFNRALKRMISLSKEYNIGSVAINLEFLKEIYGPEYIESLNRVLRSDEYKFDDFIVFLCG